MKNIIIIIYALFILNCDLRFNQSLDYDFFEAIDYAFNNIFEIQEPMGIDDWQYPETTIELGTGDCEDIAGLIMYLSGEGLFCGGLMYNAQGEILGGHAAVKYQGQYYDNYGLIEGKYIFEEIYTLTFNQYIRRCDF